MKLFYRFVKWAFSRGTLPYWCIFAYDTLSVLVSGLFVYTPLIPQHYCKLNFLST